MAFLRCFFISLIAGFNANAIVVKLSDMQTMAKRSDIIIHGHVGEQTVTYDDKSRLITLTEIEVVDSIYGAKTNDIIMVYQVGGEKDGIVMPILGGQQYHVGQEVILFGLQLDNAFVSYGAGQGKLDIFNDHGRDLVIEDLGDVEAIDYQKNAFKPSPETFVGVGTLKSEIREMLKAR